MIRKLEERDLPKLHERLSSLSQGDKEFFHPHPFTLTALRDLLGLTYDHYFVKEIDHTLIGYSMLRTFGKYEIPTFGGVIWEEYRGKGYGSVLLEDTLTEAKKIGFNLVKLKVYEQNMRAFNLYKKHGFTILGKEGDEIWMEKHIS